MVMASWPVLPRRPGRAAASDRVRRLTDAAMQRALRRSVMIGLPVLAMLVMLDDAQGLLRTGTYTQLSAPVDVVVLGLDALALLLLRRGRLAAAPVALVALLLSVAASLVTIRLDAGALPSSSAFIATMLAASGLFLPWPPRWHWAWLASAVGLVAVTVVSFTPAAGGVGMLAPLAVAALASAIGQPMLHRRLRRMTEQQLELRLLSRYARAQDAKLVDLNGELLRSARTDSLTGLGNRRALDETLGQLAGRRLAAVLLDVDQFKTFNDRNGHLAGDVALQRVGRILRESVRGDDLAFRYGGEEFLILVPDGEEKRAAALAERLRRAVEHESGPGAGELTISAGVAVADRFSAANPLPLLRRADAALYQAKRRGRNRVVLDGEPAEEHREADPALTA
jgi:diguanylate cyclase (GGDEF)-like protein